MTTLPAVIKLELLRASLNPTIAIEALTVGWLTGSLSKQSILLTLCVQGAVVVPGSCGGGSGHHLTFLHCPHLNTTPLVNVIDPILYTFIIEAIAHEALTELVTTSISKIDDMKKTLTFVADLYFSQSGLSDGGKWTSSLSGEHSVS